ncbi:MAG: LptF/LptG family permease [Planctomycetota bacterium]|nr:LptF/LptG family permease [Planctomycetota bacterium]
MKVQTENTQSDDVQGDSARSEELTGEKDTAADADGFQPASSFRLLTIDLYVSRTFLVSYAICAVSFVGLFVSIEAFAKLDRFLKQDSPLLVTLWRYHLAMIPTVFVHYIGPVLTAAAGMFTVTLLNRHNELTAVKAAGVSMYRILAPIFVIAALLTGFTFILQEDILPHFRGAIRTALAFSKARPLEPDPFLDDQYAQSIKVKQYSTTRRIGTAVEVLQSYPDMLPKTHIDARQLVWVPTGGHDGSEGYWELHHGSIQRWNENGGLITNENAEKFEKLKKVFKRRRLETSLRPIDLETSDLDISYLSWHELKTQYQRQKYHRHLAVKLHQHFAFPLAHILLLLLALPIVLKLESRSILLGVAVSVVIGAAFYFLSSICLSIAHHSEFFSPVLAAWLPVMLFGSLGITLFDGLPT